MPQALLLLSAFYSWGNWDLKKLWLVPVKLSVTQQLGSSSEEMWPGFGRLQGSRPWCWKRLRAGGEGDDRGWVGWMASPTQWTWVWVSSGSWWWIGRPGVLRFMGSQGVGHDWVTELNWTEINFWSKTPFDENTGCFSVVIDKLSEISPLNTFCALVATW